MSPSTSGCSTPRKSAEKAEKLSESNNDSDWSDINSNDDLDDERVDDEDAGELKIDLKEDEDIEVSTANSSRTYSMSSGRSPSRRPSGFLSFKSSSTTAAGSGKKSKM